MTLLGSRLFLPAAFLCFALADSWFYGLAARFHIGIASDVSRVFNLHFCFLFPLPHFAWASLSRLQTLSDFIGEAKAYKLIFEDPLDDASECLRAELARIVGNELVHRPKATKQLGPVKAKSAGLTFS